MSTVTSRDGTTIGYSRVGEGPAVVLVDAACCFRGGGPMPAVAEALTGYTAYTYDRRGRGESTDRGPYAVEREVEDLAAVVEAAGGSAFVHGFSSGAVLALHAAAAGVPIRALTLLEPPLSFEAPSGPDPRDEITALVAAGRRGDAVIRFQVACGIPEEFTTGIRQSPGWPALEAMAHTTAYDLTITATVPDLGSITAPTLVLDSRGSDERLRGWADGVAERLPNARRRTLDGDWHGVAPNVLAGALAEHFS
ncbi:alpha/beta hydrolase family protein [Saccharothrix saharensis]|uniref:Alpha/beta hydrolase family protein n=1 Tax=Saccharothrix saharensis TaxID=571190 RepID=A0A543J841_9PSEU|nr:alpha/beta fold hydrolase [Saccharothrix saharensis]TQM78976.1 alpha/beta hydrolase family protein [Saccharothrix saharensis]